MTTYYMTRYALSSGKLGTVQSDYPPERGRIYIPSLHTSLLLGRDIFADEHQARDHVLNKMIPKKQESLAKQSAELEKMKAKFA